MRWFRISVEMLNDFPVQTLPPEVFKQRFFEALHGAENEFSPFIEDDRQNGRLNHQEWALIRSHVFERDDYTCAYCGDRGGKLECDHVHPISRGGSNDIDNLITSCRACNRAKHAKIVNIDEWRSIRRRAS